MIVSSLAAVAIAGSGSGAALAAGATPTSVGFAASALGVKATANVSKPSSPSSLKATAGTSGTVVTWKAPSSTAPLTYTVYRGTSSSQSAATKLATGLNGLTYNDASAPAGVKSYYWVTATNSAGTGSAASTSATRPAAATPTPTPTPTQTQAPAPAPATSLIAKAGTGSVALTWSKSPTSGITGYHVYRVSAGTTALLTTTSSSSTSYTDSGLTVGSSYSYQVRAVSAGGVESASVTSNTVTVVGDTTPPKPPSSAKSTATANVGVTISWSKNTEADVAGYRVQKRNSDGTYVAYLPASGTGVQTATSFADTTVAEGTTAYYRIFAVDNSGNVSSYTSVSAPLPNTAPAVPTSLKAAGGPGVSLSWKADTEPDLAGYSVYRSATSSGTYALLGTVAAVTGTAPTFTDSSAPQGVAQFYKVSATDRTGNASAESAAVSGTSTVAPTPIPTHPTILTVGATGQFTTIAAALATIPVTNLSPYEIDIAPGTYHETFEIASPYVTLKGMGTSSAGVVISDNKVAGATDPSDGQPYGTAGSATVFVSGHDVTLTNLTVSNTWVEGSDPTITSQQAVALRVEGDRFVANGTQILGNQDTLLADTPKPTTRSRQYYVNSYIEGDVDFLFGAADAVFDHDVLRSLDRGKSDNGAITAASTDGGSSYGFLISNSRIVSSSTAGTVHLGRPWHPGATTAANPSVVYINDYLPSAIAVTQPWEDFPVNGVDFTWQSARLSEYKDIGPGATTNANRPQLSDKNALKATPAVYLAGKDGWNPVVSAGTVTPVAPTGLTDSVDSRVVNLSWDDVNSADVIGWDVYRATTAGGPFTKIATVDRTSYTDSGLTNGSTYSYAITAVTRTGSESAQSSAVSVTVNSRPLTASITVAADGSGDYTTVAAALAAAPAGTVTTPTVIGIKPGTYNEQLSVSKPYTDLVGLGSDPTGVVLEFDVAHGTINPATGAPYGTGGSAAVTVSANNTLIKNLTIANHWDPTAHPEITDTQAVALRTLGDRQVYETVRILGRQDTLEADTVSASTYDRSYFVNSYIEGTVDFIFGRGSAVFDRDTIHGLNRAGGTVVAPDTSNLNPHGYLIYDSKITADSPTGTFDLGRPWPALTQAADPVNYSKAQTTVVGTYLGAGVTTTKPWIDWTPAYTWDNGRWAEYQNTGPGATVNSLRPQLTATQAATADPTDWLASTPSVNDGWNPVADATTGAPAPVTGLADGTDSNLVTLTWTESADSRVTGYQVYRTTDGTASTDAAHLVATLGTATYSDHTVSNGTAYTYTVVATTADAASTASATVTATPAKKPLVATATVAADGTGDYSTVAAALAAVPAGTAVKPSVIFIKPGTYHEVVSVTKPYTILKGSTGNAADVVITYDNANGTAVSGATCPAVTSPTCGTYGSATATVSANDVTLEDLTIANSFDSTKHPEVGTYNTQAVALRATGDEGVYDNVRLLGVQDTLDADANGNITADGSGYPRQYYVDSFIEGNVDFVFGRATAAFDRDTFLATNHSGGTIFAPSTASLAKGYLVTDSRIASDNDAGTFFLGRPWRAWSDGAYGDNSRGQTVIVDTNIAAGITSAHPWTDFAPNVSTDGRFDEYGNTGPGAAVNANRPQLSDAAAAQATAANWIAGGDGWNPVVAAPAAAAPSAPAGVASGIGDTQVTLTWNENAESDVVGYHVYRVQGSGPVPIDAAHRIDPATLTRTGFTDTGLTDGTAYSYAVTAVNSAGDESAASATVTATPALHVDAVVAADGSGNYTTVQAAVNAITDGHVGRTLIQVKPGTYAGTITIPAAKGAVTLLGSTGNAADVTLTAAPAAGTATLTIPGNLVTVQDLTIANTAGITNSPAVYMVGDQIVLDDVNLTATDRAVWADVPTAGATSRQLIENSTITGATNLVLGRATLAIDHSTIIPTQTSGTVFIPSTTAANGHGFLVNNSTIAPAAGVSDVRLGGPYAQGPTTNSGSAITSPETVIRNTVENAGIKSQPWQDFNGYHWTDARFDEYADTGAGSGTTDLRPQLAPAASVNDTVNAWLGGGSWYPAIADPAAPADVTAPGAPTGFTAATGSKTATLTWTAPADSDLASYRLYRSTTSPVATTYATLLRSGLTATTYTDTGLTDGTPYYYALVAVDNTGNLSTVATTTATSADTQAPAAPAGLAAGSGDGRVTLTWTANTEPDLAGYNVYAAGSTMKLNSALLTSPSFTRTGLTDGTAYSYVVTAVDTAGNESAASAPATATPAAGDSTAPAVPAAVVSAQSATRTAPAAAGTPATWAPAVKVSWTADTDADLAGYSVYRSTGGGAAVRVSTGLVTATTFTDTSVTGGTAYTYTVTATDNAGNESAASTATSFSPGRVDVVVAADGSGDATTVNAGINLIANNADYTGQGGRTVLVQPGTYSEAVVGGNRYGISLIGATTDPKTVVITSAAGASPALTLQGKQWTVSNLTLSNTGYAALGANATALKVSAGDKDVFTNDRILGDDQALQLSTSGYTAVGRMYFGNDYIQGGNYTVIGRATAVFDRSTFHVLNEPGSSIVDSSLDTAVPYGFLITNSTITTDAAAAVTAGTSTASIYLGQPYPDHGTVTAQITVRTTTIDAGVRTDVPWKDWNASTPWTAQHFFSYQNTGAGSAVTNAATSPQLSDDSTSATWQGNYTLAKYLNGSDGWNPAS